MHREPGDEARGYYSTDNLNQQWEELKALSLFDARLLQQYEMKIIAARSGISVNGLESVLPLLVAALDFKELSD